MKFLLFMFLVCIGVTGCTHNHSAREENTSSEIIKGMTLAEVIETKGKHYRPFYGPRTGEIALIYDDITIHISGGTLPEYGQVQKIEATTPSIEEWVAKAPYVDKQK